jgi:hypothetical protein
MSKQFT